MDMESKKKIGSILDKTGKVLIPITPEEQDRWMPEIVQMGKDEKGYRQAVTEWWADMTILVPPPDEKGNGGGIELEIGLRDKKEPIDLLDYLKYRLIKEHPRVAMDGQNHSGDDVYFFIVDPNRVRKEENEQTDWELQATEIFLTNLGNREVINAAITLIDDSINQPEKMELIDLKKVIMNEIRKDPKKVHDIFSDKKIATRAMLKRMVSLSLITKAGNAYYFGEEKMGDSFDAAIKWIENPTNSEQVMILKERASAASVKELT